MPRRAEHSAAGILLGGTFAAIRSDSPESNRPFLEILGGGLGGHVGGRLPDLIEPACHPGHRAMAHALVPVGGLGALVGKKLEDAQGYCRLKAREAASVASSTDEPIVRLLWLGFQLFWDLAAGFVAGLVAGYGSHLLLDGFTPAGLPLLGMGR